MKRQTKYTLDDQLFGNFDKFQSIDAEQDWQKVRGRMDFKTRSKIRGISAGNRTKRFWLAAAMIIILIGVGFLTRPYLFTSPVMMHVSTGEMQQEIQLPDGSVVSLNQHSELAYPEKFGRKFRLLTFSGQAFFEVAGNPEKPFIINISDMANVEVLGTSFTINAPLESDFVKVNVIEGRVGFYSSAASAEMTILNIDQQAMLKSGSISQGKTLDKNFLSWKTGILYFDQESMEKVLEDLSTYYNRKFILEDQGMGEIHFTSVIDNQELESVLEEIRLVLGFKYTLEEEKIILYRPD